jgi:hypothetical protein
MINHHGEEDAVALFAVAISRGIGYLRSLPGVQRVVIAGHSGGGHLAAWYQNVAEHGPSACQGAEKIYPCSGEDLTGLAKPDGIILLDPTLGAFHQMSAVDPAVDGGKRKPALDMFTAANGYDIEGKRAKYSPEFAKRFYAAQAARNARIIDNALERLHAITQGKGQFSDYALMSRTIVRLRILQTAALARRSGHCAPSAPVLPLRRRQARSVRARHSKLMEK